MIVHIDKLIRHLKSQIKTANQLESHFVYLTVREAEGCLELAEAQDVIQEMLAEGTANKCCKDCKYHGTFECPLCDEYKFKTADNWYCADWECSESNISNGSEIPNS